MGAGVDVEVMVRPEGSNLEEGPNRIVHLVKAYQKLKKICKWRGVRYVTAHVFAIALFLFNGSALTLLDLAT